MLNKECNIEDIIELSHDICDNYKIEELTEYNKDHKYKHLLCKYSLYHEHIIDIFLLHIFITANFVNLANQKMYNEVYNMTCTINMNNTVMELKLLKLFGKIKIYGTDNILKNLYENIGDELEKYKDRLKIINENMIDVIPNSNVIIYTIPTGGLSNQLFKFVNYNYVFDYVNNCFDKNKNLDVFGILCPQNIRNNFDKFELRDKNLYKKLIYYRNKTRPQEENNPLNRDEPVAFIIVSKYDMKNYDSDENMKINYDDKKDYYINKITELYLFLKNSKNKKIVDYLSKYS